MDTSSCIYQPKRQEDVATRNEVKEEETGSRNSSTDSVTVLTLGLDQITKCIYCLDGTLGEDNI
jgi:hypothetical protein